jgi:hypothetical protein
VLGPLQAWRQRGQGCRRIGRLQGGQHLQPAVARDVGVLADPAGGPLMNSAWLLSVARAAEAGLAEAFVTTRDPDSLFWNRWAWHALGPRLTTWRRNGERLTSHLQRLLAPREEAEGHGAAYVAAFRAGPA